MKVTLSSKASGIRDRFFRLRDLSDQNARKDAALKMTAMQITAWVTTGFCGLAGELGKLPRRSESVLEFQVESFCFFAEIFWQVLFFKVPVSTAGDEEFLVRQERG